MERIARKFQKNPKVDMTAGRCCCNKWDNLQGAKNVLLLDMIFIVNLPRWIFAVWAKVDDDRFPIYSKVRFGSLVVFWATFMLILIIETSIEALAQAETDVSLFVNAIVYFTILSLAILLDYHFTKVVNTQAKVR